jgi:hypothetical protein
VVSWVAYTSSPASGCTALTARKSNASESEVSPGLITGSGIGLVPEGATMSK